MSLNLPAQPLSGRPWSWIRGRPRLVDGLLVGFTLVAGLLTALSVGGTQSTTAAALVISVALLLISGAALWWRRRQPVVVLVVVVAAQLALYALNPTRDPSGPALAFAVYAVSVYDRTQVRLWVAGLAIATIIAGVLLLVLSDFGEARSYIPAGAASLVAWVIGDYIRSRREFISRLVDRHHAARDQATEEERLRIARELHDVVAHNVSVMAIQAGAARVSGNGAAEALQSIETSARDTLAELNRLLGVLRKESDAPHAPQPGLDQVEGLLKSARDAGLEATLKVKGQARPLPAALDLSAYRIVQEAITNVLKHASATRVEVLIGYRSDLVALIVTDNGRGSMVKVGASTGHGLIGMRERVELFNGALRTRSSSLGGFTVAAVLRTRPV
ncbi:MAG: sensor histidine kinase [Candidatus Dormibacteraceae bacterium]